MPISSKNVATDAILLLAFVALIFHSNGSKLASPLVGTMEGEIEPCDPTSGPCTTVGSLRDQATGTVYTEPGFDPLIKCSDQDVTDIEDPKLVENQVIQLEWSCVAN